MRQPSSAVTKCHHRSTARDLATICRRVSELQTRRVIAFHELRLSLLQFWGRRARVVAIISRGSTRIPLPSNRRHGDGQASTAADGRRLQHSACSNDFATSGNRTEPIETVDCEIQLDSGCGGRLVDKAWLCIRSIATVILWTVGCKLDKLAEIAIGHLRWPLPPPTRPSLYAHLQNASWPCGGGHLPALPCEPKN